MKRMNTLMQNIRKEETKNVDAGAEEMKSEETSCNNVQPIDPAFGQKADATSAATATVKTCNRPPPKRRVSRPLPTAVSTEVTVFDHDAELPHVAPADAHRME